MLRKILACFAAGFVGIALLVLFGGTTAGLIAPGDAAPELKASQWVGGDAPDVAGKIVVVDVFATWCAPCIETTPALIEVYREFEKHGVVFVSLTTEDGNSRREVEAFRDQMNVPWTVGIDAGETVRKLGVVAIPVLIVIGPDGKVISVGDDEKKLRSTLSRAVAYQRKQA